MRSAVADPRVMRLPLQSDGHLMVPSHAPLDYSDAMEDFEEQLNNAPQKPEPPAPSPRAPPSAFVEVKLSAQVSLLPYTLGDVKGHLRSTLNELLMRCVAHRDSSLAQKTQIGRYPHTGTSRAGPGIAGGW